MTRTGYVKGGLLLLLVGGAVALQVSVGLPDQAELRAVLDGLGYVAFPAFITVYAATSLLPAGPTALLTIVGGALFGFPAALACVLCAALLGAVGSFFISRYLGRDLVREISGARLLELDRKVAERGFGTVLLARLVPLVPFSAANYAFGLTSVSGRSYVTATALGIVPGTALYVAVGAYGADPGSWPFVLAILGLVLLSLLGVLRSRRDRTAAEPA